MKNIYLIPTDKPSRLIIYSTLLNEFRLLNDPIEDWKHKRHIYITNNEEIKVGDYVYCNREGFKSVLKQKVNPMGVNNDPLMKKIILTTDVDLINDGVQVIDDEFLEWFVENPSCESVEVKELLSNNGNAFYGYKIIIPDLWGEIFDWLEQEEPKRETLEEAAKNSDKSKCKHFRREHTKIEVYDSFEEGFIEGANWHAKRSYSEEEVEQIFNIGQMVKNYGDYKPYTFKEALKQFKKK
jgi:hypothetical protein